MDLIDIKGIGPAGVLRLKGAQIKTIRDLAEASDEALSGVRGFEGSRGRTLRRRAQQVVDGLDAGLTLPSAVQTTSKKRTIYPQRRAESGALYAQCVVFIGAGWSRDGKKGIEEAIARWNNSSQWPDLFAVTLERDLADLLIGWGSETIEVVPGSPAMILLPDLQADPKVVAVLLGQVLGVAPNSDPYSIMNGAPRASRRDYEAAAWALSSIEP